jgi:hypothetical protein
MVGRIFNDGLVKYKLVIRRLNLEYQTDPFHIRSFLGSTLKKLQTVLFKLTNRACYILGLHKALDSRCYLCYYL